MIEKIRKVSNPLTIIAIFAALAEVSGTVVLPFMEKSLQSQYIWFLMIFPLSLVMLFFLTLNFNHKVLYSPSDFDNENNFMDLIFKANETDLVNKKIEEIGELVEYNEEIKISKKNNRDEKQNNRQRINNSIPEIDQVKNTLMTEDVKLKTDDLLLFGDNNKIKNEYTNLLNQKEKNNNFKISKNKIINEYKNVENLVLKKYQKENNGFLRKDIGFNLKDIKVIYDAILENGYETKVIEIKILNNTNKNNIWKILKNEFERFKILKRSQTDRVKDIKLDLILVVNNDIGRIDFEDLMNEFGDDINIIIYKYKEIEEY